MFLQAPIRRAFCKKASHAAHESYKTVSLISLPVNLGQPYLGVDNSPKLLFENGLMNLLGSCGWRVLQVPEIISTSMYPSRSVPLKEAVSDQGINAKNCAQVGSIAKQIYEQVSAHAQTDNFLLILGGDHCIPIGTIPAIIKHRPNTGIIWVDAHADINTPASSGSGNMHGMPVAFLLDLVKNANLYPGFDWFKPPYFNPSDIVYIGLRDLDNEEKVMIKKLGIKAYTMYDIDRLGIGKVMEETLTHFSCHSNLHLSYDIDALDPFFAPHTGTAVRGGLTFREANFICESLASSNKMTSMELVEVNPSLHPHLNPKQTIDMAMTLLGSSMGQTIL